VNWWEGKANWWEVVGISRFVLPFYQFTRPSRHFAPPSPSFSVFFRSEFPLGSNSSNSINEIELNCMHETNKIELKLIEVDAPLIFGIAKYLSSSGSFIYYLASTFLTTEKNYSFLINHK
jgi:hypothetical protein